MDTKAVADAMMALFRQGDFSTPGERFWADDVVSVEAMGGEHAVARGKAAVEAKGEWWSAHHEIHDTHVEGPYVNGDQFAVRFKMDLTNKDDGKRMQMEEIGLYTIKEGKIAEERFFYAG